ncbi:IucA/IucC family siderophore biosynthesis protein [Grimontia hollisae]|uniref:Aerobactin siderophore biosynthesis protein iucC n=1 Tax=Grimontia hollisae CIP 101886 TaxID=675812 RepID=D0IA89_GRIHO|nr:IucA/IucC family siderophore biosynthesis protein [Grimontia hollisae]AMG31787.1 IucA/IucC family siderophore biosynthesis protein [Grimontia hollisae]EEY70807.1 aerobactin siderophore biosynthesis protein iucC [Grimontia hollisae CIP 101886]MDF2186216.1 IucA/IucC family siderophore biosynthesis protein [Grimontia hollisae]STO44772.1 Aerobactin synthase IucC [Grimontia hollisae]
MEQNALHRFWPAANRALVAKLISELEYEQAFKLEPVGQEHCLTLPAGVRYRVKGKRNIWGQLNILPGSIRREDNGEHNLPVEASRFMLDCKTVLGLDDDTLAEHLEDLYATLLGDCKLMQLREHLDADAFARLSLEKQQCLFDGHPKFVFNKGRRAWGSEDLRHFAPESEEPFQLCWIAVNHTLVTGAISEYLNWNHLYQNALSDDDLASVRCDLEMLGLNPANFLLLPVHPWQWDNKLSLLFVAELARKEMVYLGTFGDAFLPQLSLRTLTNVSRPARYDIKLPLTIMNTSCYRGMPSRYIQAGPQASAWLENTVKSDPLFISLGTDVLQEPAGLTVSHTVYDSLEKAPYRYHELCGAIWRESASTKTRPGEQAILMAALMESDSAGNPLIGAYIRASGLSAKDWLSQLFRAVVIPYYHLLAKYGVSLIAHGQNVTLVLENSTPKRILLKDFQGDMRLMQGDIPEQDSLPQAVKDVTVTLPPDLIIHDLQTGHFVTVLRFISPLAEKTGVSEHRFYKLLAQELQAYMQSHPELEARFQLLDLFRPKIRRLGLNLAKFRHATENSADRMLPQMEHFIDNPLYLVTH